MSDFWEYARVLNFAILFTAFMILTYRGVFHLTVQARSFNWDRFMNLCWVTLSLYALGEILAQEVQGGLRVLIGTAVAVLQLYVVLFQYEPSEREVVKK